MYRLQCFTLFAEFVIATIAELGPCTWTPTRPIPSSAEEFAAIGATGPVASAADSAAERPQPAKGQFVLSAARLPLRVPETPLVFDNLDLPSPVRNMNGTGILSFLGKSIWPQRGFVGQRTRRVALDVFMDGTHSDPLYIDTAEGDTRFRRLFRSVPRIFRGIRRMPLAVLAKPKQGLSLHSLPEPRWIVQTHGSVIWKLVRPERMQDPSLGGAALRACGPLTPDIAGKCELRAGSALYVPALWGWSSCTLSRGTEDAFSLSIGAGGYSQGWPDHFHLVAEGEDGQLRRLLAKDPHVVHYGDAGTGSTALELAAQRGELGAAKLLYGSGGMINATGSFKKLYAVHQAAAHSQEAMLEWLISMGAELDVVTTKQMTPLHIAAESGHVQAVRALIAARADVHATAELKRTAVHLATRIGHLPVVRSLRDLGAEVSAADSAGCEPTVLAVEMGNIEMLDFLIGDEGLTPDAKCDTGTTPAHVAARMGRIDALDALKRWKADMRARDDAKRTPLHVAVMHGKTNVIDWYARGQVKKLSPRTPGLLHLAAFWNQTESLRSLLQHGAKIDAIDPRSKYVAAEVAETKETWEILREFGASRPPGFVQRSAGRGQLELLRRLAGQGGEYESELLRPYDGVYAVHLAGQGGHRHVLEWLCGQMGANCCQKSFNKTYERTPLHFLAMGSAVDDQGSGSSRVEALHYLIRDQGCGPDAKDSVGITPLELAGVSGRLAIAKALIMSHGADIAGLWRSKRERMLSKEVDKWITAYAPKASYEQWLKLGLPGPGERPSPAQPSPKPRRRRNRKKTKSEL